ncbi:MAG: thioesterase family protein [Halioglobus sp.]|nr:thioesterase family protein [Halioglobus sp.]
MTKRADMPTVEEIRQMPTDLTMTVPPQWEDRNGHVNVQYYLGMYELGGWQILENIGIDERYLTDRQAGIFDLEHHIRYLAEIKVGEVVSVHNRMLGRDGKRFHGMLFIVNDTCQALACTIEYLSICIDQQLRRSTAFPEDMALNLDELLARHNACNWQVPVCGSFGV